MSSGWTEVQRKGHWHCCASGGEKMSFPLSSLMWVTSHYCLPLSAFCLDCYWLLKSLSLSSLNVFPQIKFMEGMSLKETSDKDEKPCMVVYCHDTAPSTKGKLAEGSEVLCNPGCMRHYLNNNNDKIMKNHTSQRREGWFGPVWSWDLAPQKCNSMGVESLLCLTVQPRFLRAGRSHPHHSAEPRTWRHLIGLRNEWDGQRGSNCD